MSLALYLSLQLRAAHLSLIHLSMCIRDRLEEKNERIDKSKDKILREANEEAYQILQDAKELADKTIRNFNK